MIKIISPGQIVMMALICCMLPVSAQARPSEMMPLQTEITPIANDDYLTYLNKFDHDKYTLKSANFFKALQTEGILVLDLRSYESYQYGHIKGAIHIGADIDAKRLFNIVPQKQRKILLYCSNSLYMTRMVSLTDVSLPQMHILGYQHTYKAGPLYLTNDGEMIDAVKKLKELDMWVGQ